LISMGNDVNIIGLIGNDLCGMTILDILKAKFIDTSYIIVDDGRPTTSKHRVFCNNKLVSRFDIETSQEIDYEQHNTIISYLSKLIDGVEIVILSDYLKGVLSNELTKEIINFCNSKNKEIFIDPKDSNYSKYIGCTLIKPNKNEAELILNKKIIGSSEEHNIRNVLESMKEIKNKLNSKYCLLTLSENGLSMLDENDIYEHYQAIQKNVIDVTGAGDTVMASFVHYYLKTKDVFQSAQFANYCGQLKVTHSGTYAITDYDMIKYKMEYSKLVNINDIKLISSVLKKNNKKIVFTNGCFDILHYGHLMYLEEAKKLGDVLIIGLNSDKSVKKLKGELRPFNNEIYRVKQLEMLSIIDIIIIFDDDTPLNLLEKIKPEFLVKGGDYKIDNVVGREHAKEVKILQFVPDISTTKILGYLG
jgi:D-beta-D-heptose 7-phosphate kinase / D-beta-D-heptose 1-phosphate adenosyltransferase